MKKVALIIGHSAKSPGATNKTYGTSEFEFNGPLAHSVAEKLILEGYEPIHLPVAGLEQLAGTGEL
ncbi:hypothetical protein, partial [Marinobacter sp.]|uniref:hypothetical protein n=1 Tax=Marinobacter sp. TaxID=50741 RepID=UPI0035C7299F